jgi:glycosyltransferase involved in cell wall biosynthesis
MLAAHAGAAPGAIVPRRDGADFAAVISELLSDPERMAASRAAARLAGSALLWPEVARQFANVLTRVRSHRPVDRNVGVRRRRIPRAGAAPVLGR